MPGVRLSAFTKLGVCFAALIFTLHFLATSFQQTAEEVEEVGHWGERFGLDHYANWEAGVTNKLGEHVERLKGGFGVITGWGTSGAKLGSLYEVSRSSPSRPLSRAWASPNLSCAPLREHRQPALTKPLLFI